MSFLERKTNVRSLILLLLMFIFRSSFNVSFYFFFMRASYSYFLITLSLRFCIHLPPQILSSNFSTKNKITKLLAQSNIYIYIFSSLSLSWIPNLVPSLSKVWKNFLNFYVGLFFFTCSFSYIILPSFYVDHDHDHDYDDVFDACNSYDNSIT